MIVPYLLCSLSYRDDRGHSAGQHGQHESIQPNMAQKLAHLQTNIGKTRYPVLPNNKLKEVHHRALTYILASTQEAIDPIHAVKA